MFKKQEPSSINDDILSQGFSRPEAEDAVVIDAQDAQPRSAMSKKRKAQRVIAVGGAGMVLLGVAVAVMSLQSKPVAVDPAVEAVLNKSPVAAKAEQQAAPVPPSSPERVAAASQPENAPAPAPVVQPTAPVENTPAPANVPAEPIDTTAMRLAAAAAVVTTPQPSVAQAPAATAATPAAAAPGQVHAKAAEQSAVDKRLAALDESYLKAIDAISRLATRLDDMTAMQKDLKREIDRLAKSQQAAAPAVTAEKKSAALGKTAAAEAKQQEQKKERIEKEISMKEFNILAMTTESVIFGPQGKEQEIFVGAAMPGLNGKLEAVDPQGRTIVTTTRTYKVTH